MNLVNLDVRVSDYEGNEETCSITIDLNTWKVEQLTTNLHRRYSPQITIQGIGISMDREFLRKKGVRGKELEINNYNLS